MIRFVQKRADDIRPYDCAVSDEQVTILKRVSEFTSVNVARLPRHAAKKRA
jgi:hypothetical protein